MKKLIAAGLSVLMLLSCAACSGAGQNSGSGDSKAEETVAPTTIPTVAQDTVIKLMAFTAPEGYDTVERFFEKTSDGAVKEKDITYKFSDKSKIVYACMTDIKWEDEIPSDKTTPGEYGGETYMMYESGSSKNAMIQKGEDGYAVSYSFAESVDNEKFDNVMANVKYNGSGEMVDNNNVQLDSIQYTIDSALNVYATTSTVEESSAGTPTKKGLGWKFGKDKDNVDFSFSINEYKNTTVEQKLNKEKKYEQKQINGITYTVRAEDSGKKPYELFTQHGNDVYCIYNGGKSGMFTTRNEECEAAFEKFVNSISFK